MNGFPRHPNTYRSNRRNGSKFGRENRDWYGVETKRKELPIILRIVSDRGEASYVSLERIAFLHARRQERSQHEL